jgi:hypothetical protein
MVTSAGVADATPLDCRHDGSGAQSGTKTQQFGADCSGPHIRRPMAEADVA